MSLSAKRDEQVKVTGQIADNLATIYGKVVDSVSEGLEIADAEIEAAAKTLLLADRAGALLGEMVPYLMGFFKTASGQGANSNFVKPKLATKPSAA